MGTHTQFLNGSHFGSLWKQSIAGLGIAFLSAFAIHQTMVKWTDQGLSEALMMAGLLAGPAITYAFGYFWCVPETLGGVSSDSHRTLYQRWVDFASLGTFFAAAVIIPSYARVIYMEWSYVEPVRAVSLVLVASWMLPCCVMATDRYLNGVLPAGNKETCSGWRAFVRRTMQSLGAWPVRWLGPSSATLLGGALMLLSLALVVDGDIFGSEHRGYEVLLNAVSSSWGAYSSPIWPMGPARGIRALTAACQWLYGLSLLVALFAMVGVGAERLGKILPGKKILAVFAGTVALLEVTETAPIPLVDSLGKWVVVAWIACWAIPIGIWIAKSKSGKEGEPARMAILVFYLPFFMIGFALSVLFSYFAFGHGAFLLGMLMLWWGVVQSNQALTRRNASGTTA